MTGPRFTILLAAPLLTMTLLGCPTKTAETAKTVKTTQAAKTGQAAAFPARDLTDATVPVVCGCKLPIKKCSEWATVEDKPVKLKGDLGLKGSMPFCGKTGLTAKVSGKLEGDTLTVTAFELLPKAN